MEHRVETLYFRHTKQPDHVTIKKMINKLPPMDGKNRVQDPLKIERYPARGVALASAWKKVFRYF